MTWAFTRDGALIAARSMQTRRALSPVRKVVLILVGSVLLGFGISCFLHAQLGLPPTDVLISAVAGRTGLAHGPASWLVGGILFGAATALGRRPSIYGLLFVAANGLSIDAWDGLLVDPARPISRILFVGLGVAAVAAGVALVADSSSTGGPTELLTKAASDRGRSPIGARSAIEGSVIVVGIALGGELGVGTVLFALTIGPAISFAVTALADQRAGREQRREIEDLNVPAR